MYLFLHGSYGISNPFKVESRLFNELDKVYIYVNPIQYKIKIRYSCYLIDFLSPLNFQKGLATQKLADI